MNKEETCLQALLQQKLLPLYYHDSGEKSVAILHALYDGGIRILEYTNRGSAALENFKVLKQVVDTGLSGLQLGIGTIKSAAQAKDYIEAGADFIVCPSMNGDVAEVCKRAQLLWIPGCMTPTEVAAAENAGATLVKIFPGTLLGPSYISAIKDLFPGMRFIITGGVEAEEENLKGWFGAGVIGVGMGSRLITKTIIEGNDFDGLKQATISALQLVARCSVT
jgi:2-dehydro-3-deoxyphosphogluconate aldolase/(4S)-4-hydroxy-2-oxoglutarate aldolase